MREENKSNKKGKVWNDPEQWGEFPAELTGFLSQLPPRCQMALNTGNQLNPTNHLYIKGWFTWKTWEVHFHILKSQFPCNRKWCQLQTAVSIKSNLDNAKFTYRKYSSNDLQNTNTEHKYKTQIQIVAVQFTAIISGGRWRALPAAHNQRFRAQPWQVAQDQELLVGTWWSCSTVTSCPGSRVLLVGTWWSCSTVTSCPGSGAACRNLVIMPNRDKLLLVGPMYKELDKLLLVGNYKEVDMINRDKLPRTRSCL